MKKKILTIMTLFVMFFSVSFVSADDTKNTTEYKDLKKEFSDDLIKWKSDNIQIRLKSYITDLDNMLKDCKNEDDSKIRALLLKADALLELVDDYEYTFSKKDDDIFDYYDDLLDNLEDKYKYNYWKACGVSNPKQNTNNNANSNANSNNSQVLKANYKKVFQARLWNTIQNMWATKADIVLSRIEEMQSQYMMMSSIQARNYTLQLEALKEMIEEVYTPDLIDLDKLFE